MAEPTPRWQDDTAATVAALAVDFFERTVIAQQQRWDDEHVIAREVWREAGDRGLLSCSIPESYGGGGGTFAHDLAVFDAQGFTADLSLGIGVNSGIVPHYILEYGTEAQKHEWLPLLASGEVVGAIGMTEPGAGSDLKAIRTSAVRDGDEYVINGAKTFITNGAIADLIVLAVNTGPRVGSKGVSLILVDVRNAPGYSVGRVLDKIGQNGGGTSELSFTDVRVPAANLLGPEEGLGFAQMMAQLPQERLIIAAQATGSIRRAVKEAIAYTKGRNAFGQSVFDFQNTAFELAECHTISRTCEAFLGECIASHLRGELSHEEAAMAKYWLTDKQCEVIDRCLQLHGGYGYIREYPIARMYEDARVQRIYAGTNEVMKLIISRSL